MADSQGRFGSRPAVTVDGEPLAADVVPALVQVVVDGHLHLPDMFVLRFQDHGRDVLDRSRIRFGCKVAVAATAAGDGTMTALVTGEVTALEQETDATGTWVVVRGYDPCHRLCRGRRTRSFRDTTDAEIVSRVAGEAGVALGAVDRDGPVYPHVSQVNLSDWEFLRARAQETGHELAAVGGRLEWRALRSSGDAPAPAADLVTPPGPDELVLGRNLLRFRPRVTASAQVGEVRVRGWDPAAKQAVLGSATAATASAAVGITPGELAGIFDAAPFVVVDRPVDSQSEADAVAGAVAEQIAGAHAEAEGTAYGDPRLVPGAAVSVGCAGWPHDGRYVLTATRHRYDEDGYHTDFTVSGRQERSLLGLASLGATKGAHRAGGPPVYGLVVAEVTDVGDPRHQFRVKVRFPWLADDYESWWARVAQPGAGDGRGLAWLPEVGDEVLVGFAHGDVRAPYVVGGLYNGVDRPPLAGSLVDDTAGTVQRRALVSRQGHRLVLSDDDSRSEVELATGDGKLTITLDSSGTRIVVDSSGTVSISGSRGVEISSGADLTVKAQGGLTLQATGELKLSGRAGVTVDGGPSVAVTGGVVKLN
ncbi:VgrG-related protein [Kitasatospora sp. NPDC049285]|uniref:VgrG-related protein n=1 Tax=Kitasatospora sp. NPDC049285 TaxID=3157096 RepID=UPI00341B63AA